MQVKPPKNDRNYYWTMHSQRKLFQYGLTPNKIKRIIRYPDRKEEGIAPETIAVMKRKNRKNPKKGEIWVMYQRKSKVKSEKLTVGESREQKISISSPLSTSRQVLKKRETKRGLQVYSGQVRIISAWIYPGKTPKGKEIFIPDEAWEELQKV